MSSINMKQLFLTVFIFIISSTQIIESKNINVNLNISGDTNEPLNNACIDTLSDNEHDIKILKFRDDYTFYKGFGYYKYHINHAPWLTAKYICELEGAHLVVINSQKEADLVLMIYNINPRSPLIKHPDHVLVGFHDLHVQGQYETIFGTELKDSGFMKWTPGHPGNIADENCGAMYLNGLLNDYPCSVSTNFICEKEEL